MVSIRPRYLPLPQQDSPEAGRLILRDGTTATIRMATFEDREPITKFFASLSDESRWRRFFSLVPPPAKLIDSFCDSSSPRKQLTLIVTRLLQGRPRVIAASTYVSLDETTAEVAMAVEDNFQGKGIGTLLLERLAVLAIANGIVRFRATTRAENRPMLDVFQNSGFECHTHLDKQYVEIDFSLLPTKSSVAQSEVRDRVSTVASLRPFFYPRSVAVIGASRSPNNIGARILSAILGAGFKGSVYPVNPKADVVASLKAYPSLRELPEAPDLVVIAVPAMAVDSVIDDCAARDVRAVIVITAGYAEVDAAGRERQKALLDKIRGYGMRMVGPNCLGLLNTDPSVCLNASFAPDFPAAGNVAFCSQSGALGVGRDRPREPAQPGPIKLHQRRQQSRRFWQRLAAVLGRRRTHKSDSSLLGVFR
jgi:predicted CoA-binding protein/GNAT superfamily N-acetyltransferase